MWKFLALFILYASAALAQNPPFPPVPPVVGGVVRQQGGITIGNCAQWTAQGRLGQAAAPCGSGGSNILLDETLVTQGSGTPQLAGGSFLLQSGGANSWITTDGAILSYGIDHGGNSTDLFVSGITAVNPQFASFAVGTSGTGTGVIALNWNAVTIFYLSHNNAETFGTLGAGLNANYPEADPALEALRWNNAGQVQVSKAKTANGCIYSNAGGFLETSAVILCDGNTGTIQHGISLVANLPSCDAAHEGAHYGVTDALLPAFLATVSGGGGVHAPVYCDGTNWIVE